MSRYMRNWRTGRIGRWSYNSRKLANGDPPSGNGTLLANGVAPLANGEIGGRRGTVPLNGGGTSVYSTRKTTYRYLKRPQK
jgi:hypothetical protein